MKRTFYITVFSFFLISSLLAKDEVSSFAGIWRGFITLAKGNEIVFQTSETYMLNPDNTWEIRSNNSSPIPQGWYKIEKNQLYLQPAQAVKRNINSAITATIITSDIFEIPNPIDNTYKMRFIRCSKLSALNNDNIIGKWKIVQRNLYTNETKEAPYIIILKSNGKYQLEQADNKLPEEWASGTYSIKDSILTLENNFSGNGLWNKPAFFFINGRLRYNNPRYCLWLEPINSTVNTKELK